MKLFNGPLRRLRTTQLELYNPQPARKRSKDDATAAGKVYKDAMPTHLISAKLEYAKCWMIYSHYNITQ